MPRRSPFRAELALAAALLGGCAGRVASPELAAAPGGEVAMPPFVNSSAASAAPDAMRTLTAGLLQKMGYRPLPYDEGSAVPAAGFLCRGEVTDFTLGAVGPVLRRSVRLKLRILRVSDGKLMYEGRGSGVSSKGYPDAGAAREALAAQGGGREPGALAREASDAAWEALEALPRRNR